MEYANINEVRNLAIDHTSRCNLACPQCSRTDNNILPLDELTVEDYKVIIPPLVNSLNRILYCGNYGDAIVSNTLIPSLEWIYNDSGFKGHIHIITNGSARSPAWWTNLAKLMGNRGSVAFSIDGLSDTNALYRINSNFDKIMANAAAFIAAGGHAEWDFLVFQHNEHQIDDVVALAKKMGFYSITIKQTNRFRTGKDTNNLNNTSMVVKTKSTEHVIQMPTKKEYQGSGKSQYQSIIEKHKTWDNYINATTISCKMKAGNSIFVDFQARLWACTWTAGGIYYDDIRDAQRIGSHKILDTYGWNFNSLRHHTLSEVLGHEYYAEKICASWTGSITDPIPKLETCGRMCGADYEFSSGWEDSAKKGSNKNNQKIQLK